MVSYFALNNKLNNLSIQNFFQTRILFMVIALFLRSKAFISDVEVMNFESLHLNVQFCWKIFVVLLIKNE